MYNERSVPDLATHERILVVDDEEPIREVVCSMLGSAGYCCTPAAYGMKLWQCSIPARNSR